MFLRLLASETRKLLKQPLLWLGLTGLPVLLAVYLGGRYARLAAIAGQGLSLDRQAELGLLICLSIFAALVPLLSAAAGPDRSEPLWLAGGGPRPLLRLARLVVGLFFSLILGLVAVFVLLGLTGLS